MSDFINKPKTGPRARSRIRFTPEGNEFAILSFNLELFQNDLEALIINESTQGSCVVFNKKFIPKDIIISKGIYVLVKIGKLEPVRAIVRWINNIDSDLMKVGFENTEHRYTIKFK